MLSSSAPKFIPLQSLDGISLVDSNLNHVVSIASLSNSPCTASQIAVLKDLITFPGLRRAFHYYFDNSNSFGVTATMFGPVLIQLQPTDTIASLLYLEQFPNNRIGYSILFKRFTVENGLPVFSEKIEDCIHFARAEELQTYFNRVHPVSAVLSTLISLANGIYFVDHGHNENVMNFLEQKISTMQNQRMQNFENPGGLLLAPYGKDQEGRFFGIEEPEESEESTELFGSWKDDFHELLMNFRKYIPPLLEFVSISELAPKQPYFVNKSLGPIRVKYISDTKAVGLFVHLRSNSIRGFEFWAGDIPYEGSQRNPVFNYNKIIIKKRELTSTDFADFFPSLDSLDLLLPLFLQASEMFHSFRSPYKEINEIIDECKKNYPRETCFALDNLAKRYGCPVDKVWEEISEDIIKDTLYQSIHVGRESRKLLKDLESYKNLGSVDGVVIPGSPEEFKLIKKERIEAVRAAARQDTKRERMEIDKKKSHIMAKF